MDTRQMTDDQLIAKAANYKAGMLEGGEGYNPYEVEIDRRQAAKEAARAKSRAERRYELLREIESLDCSMARESGTYDPDRIAALRAEVEAIDTEREAEFAAEWTLEVTKARREEWNTRVLAGEFGSAPTCYKAMRAAEHEQGWTSDDLRRAVKMHQLPKWSPKS